MNIPPIKAALSLSASGAADKLKTAKKFEAMAIGAMLKPMFETMGKADAPFGAGPAEKEFRPFFISAIAKAMESHGGIGLAPEIESAMAQRGGNNKK